MRVGFFQVDCLRANGVGLMRAGYFLAARSQVNGNTCDSARFFYRALPIIRRAWVCDAPTRYMKTAEKKDDPYRFTDPRGCTVFAWPSQIGNGLSATILPRIWHWVVFLLRRQEPNFPFRLGLKTGRLGPVL